MKKLFVCTVWLVAAAWLSGCVSVPMAPPEEDQAMKRFDPPSKGMSGLYIFRDSTFGGALLKSIYVDGKFLGESGPNVYFYTEVSPGKHTLSTESEFSENHIELTTEPNRNYYIRQYIKFGVFVGGANFEIVSKETGQAAVRACKLAISGKSQTDGQPDQIRVPQ